MKTLITAVLIATVGSVATAQSYDWGNWLKSTVDETVD